MKSRNLISLLAALLLALPMYAAPARRGAVYLSQPDGQVFKACLRGDEFLRVKTTAEGHSIIQEDDGWWCYAVYDAAGQRVSTGYKVGYDTPHEVLQESSRIPFDVLSRAARERRQGVDYNTGTTPMMKRIRPYVKSEGQETTVKHGLVILAEYRDVRFTYGKDDFERLLNEEGYSVNGATGSAKQYFDDQFSGRVVFDFMVSPIVTLSKTRAYYGANDADGSDKAPAEMIKEACEKADADVDFSLYDDDGDGTVDNVFVFFAGADEAEGADEECIWSHAWYIRSGAGISLTLDGKKIDRYACTAELTRVYTPGKVRELISGIGTFCHEYSHTFGLPDFYDTDYDKTGGWAAGLWGSTSLMDAGNQNNGGNTPPYFNALEREILGLTEPVMLETPGRYSLEPLHESNAVYRLDTDTEGEYYLFECRAEKGWDAYIGGNGMLVYHLDKSRGVLDRWNYYNTVNTDRSHQCADLVEADSRSDGFSDDNDYINRIGNIKGIFFPSSGVNSLTPDGTPSLTFWSGAVGSMGITAITRTATGVSFNLVDGQDGDGPPVAVDMDALVSSDAAIIRFSSSRVNDAKAVVSWGRTGRLDSVAEVEPYKPGKYALKLEGLEPQGKTYTVTVKFVSDEMEGEMTELSFMTKSRPPVAWPYIYFGNVERNTDGSFPQGARVPLMLQNSAGAEAVEWYMDDLPVTDEGDWYITLGQSGTLKAVVYREDGGKDVIIKEMTVR